MSLAVLEHALRSRVHTPHHVCQAYAETVGIRALPGQSNLATTQKAFKDLQHRGSICLSESVNVVFLGHFWDLGGHLGSFGGPWGSFGAHFGGLGAHFWSLGSIFVEPWVKNHDVYENQCFPNSDASKIVSKLSNFDENL